MGGANVPHQRPLFGQRNTIAPLKLRPYGAIQICLLLLLLLFNSIRFCVFVQVAALLRKKTTHLPITMKMMMTTTTNPMMILMMIMMRREMRWTRQTVAGEIRQLNTCIRYTEILTIINNLRSLYYSICSICVSVGSVMTSSSFLACMTRSA